MKRNIFYIFCLSLFLALPLAAQETEEPQRVDIPDYFPSETLSADREICFKPGIHLTPEQVEICREAHKAFYRELKVWLDNAENTGFINEFKLSSDKENTKEIIDYLSTYTYSANPDEGFTGIAVIRAFQMLKATQKIALGIVPEGSQEKARAYRTSTPLDMFSENVNADTPSLFQKIYSNSLTAPYLQTIMKTIRMDVFYLGPLDDYLTPTDNTRSEISFASLHLKTLIPQLMGTDLNEKQDYYIQLSQSADFLSLVNSAENKCKKVLKGESSSFNGGFGSFTF